MTSAGAPFRDGPLPADPSPIGSRRRAWRHFALFAAVALMTRGLLLGVPVLDLDEASYAAGSWELLRGRLLYTDFADHHPPLVYVYYALAQLLLGRGMLAVRLLTTLVTLPLTALAASALFDHDRRGRLAGLLYLLYGAAYLAHDFWAVNGELLLLLPASWAIVAVRDEAAARRPRRLFVCGLLLGVAVLFKYQAALWLVAVAVAVPNPAALLVLAAGFALPLATSAAYFAARRGLDGFLYWNLTHNFQYTANPISGEEAGQRLVSTVLPLAVVTAWLWWAWARSRPLETSIHRLRLVGALVATSVLAAVLGFRFYPHYFVQLLWPLSVGAAPFAASLLRRPLSRAARLALGHTAVVVVGFAIANGALYLGSRAVHEETLPVYAEVARALRADRCFEGSTLFVWGYAPTFYYFADRPLASRFVFPEATLVGYVPGNRASASGQVDARDRVREEHWQWLLDDLDRNQATYILDTAPAGIHRWQNYPLRRFPRLAELIDRDYERIDRVDGVDVYRRRGCAAR